MKKSNKLKIGLIVLLLAAVVYFTIDIFSKYTSQQLLSIYQARQSTVIKDRNNIIISIKPNTAGFYSTYINEVPEYFKELLLKTEDQYFYNHPGINPVSMFRAQWRLATGDGTPASSTITQQLVKILLGNEFDRTIKNKVHESFYALALESRYSKDEILNMYINSIYFGNQVQGLEMASQLYFTKPPEALTEPEVIRLISTISSPSRSHPFTERNLEKSKTLATRLDVEFYNQKPIIGNTSRYRSDQFNKYVNTEAAFEATSLIQANETTKLTIDKNLTDSIRQIIQRNIQSLANKNATHASVVVINLPQNEILSIVGSPDPNSALSGNQINMAIKPRPIGSTVKPLIYLKAFERGLRPYTIVEDKEYKYIIGSGFAFYPKNYDYQYRGPVTLHYALANSLNVPTVKTLEYVGIDNFYDFLQKQLEFKPIQDIDNYELGIALGGLEMDLLTLSYYFTLFANEGRLKPLKLYANKNSDFQTQTDFLQDKQISEPQYVQLVNKILTDRQTGVEQFGQKNNLMFPGIQVAAKTGTSREYHDSWTIGFTPDFVVGVWLGNAENTAMEQVSGESGAGQIWHEVMQLLINSPYNKHTPFEFGYLTEYYNRGSLEYGLPGDNYNELQQKITQEQLIIEPHPYDTFLLEPNTQIPLKASQVVTWLINGENVAGQVREFIFAPKKSGIFKIKAQSETGLSEEITIYIENN